MKLPAARPQGI